MANHKRLGVAAIALTFAGCAGGPDPEVVRAQTAVQTARDDPLVQAHAPATLRAAEQALARAQTADADGADEAQIDHLAYLAEQEAAIAQFVALEEHSQQQLASLGAQLEAVEDQLSQQLEQLRAERTERGVVVTLDDVRFEVNGAGLQPGAQTELLRIADLLQQQPNSTVVIEGHTDNTGSPDYNLRLSQLRADSVRSFLIANGIPPLRMQAIGFGETRPEAPNDNAAGRQQNRRVEIVIQDVEPIVRASGG